MTDLITTTNSIGLIIPQPQHKDTPDGFNPAKPLTNTRHELVVTKIIQGLDRIDAYLLQYPNCKARMTASQGVSRIFKDPKVKARYAFMLHEKQQIEGVPEITPVKTGNPGDSRDPGGQIDIKTRAGRLSVVEMVVQDYLNGGSVRTDAVLKAVDRLVTMHGDQEALEAERSKIPISAIIAHLIQCEIAGRNPLAMPAADLPEILCRLFNLDSCAVVSESVEHTHRVKGKERTHSELIAHKQGAIADSAMHTVCNDNDLSNNPVNSQQPTDSPYEIHTPTANPTPPAQIPPSVTPTSLETSPACVAPELVKSRVLGKYPKSPNAISPPEWEEELPPIPAGVLTRSLMPEKEDIPVENKIDATHGLSVEDAEAYEEWRRGGQA